MLDALAVVERTLDECQQVGRLERLGDIGIGTDIEALERSSSETLAVSRMTGM